MVNSGSRCTIGKNNRGHHHQEVTPARNNNEKARVLEPWKYEVTKGALCVGIDMVQGWHCAPSRGWSSSQDQMPKLGQWGEKEKEKGGGGILNIKEICGSLF